MFFNGHVGPKWGHRPPRGLPVAVDERERALVYLLSIVVAVQ